MAKKFTLLFLVVILPFSFFYFFSTGLHRFEDLPYYGPQQNEKEFVFTDFSLHAVNNTTLSKKDFKGKILVTGVLQPGCPYDCKWDVNLFKFTLYNEIIKESKMQDIIVLTEVKDSSSSGFLSQMQGRLGVDEKRWMMFYSEVNPFFEVEMDGKKYSEKISEKTGEPLYLNTFFLIDKDFHLRGIYDITQSVQMIDLLSDLRLLIKEYAQK